MENLNCPSFPRVNQIKTKQKPIYYLFLGVTNTLENEDQFEEKMVLLSEGYGERLVRHIY